MRTFASLVFVAALATAARANGFLLNEFDAREVGRGDAGAATDYDPSSIYYNVGGLAGGDGTRITIAGSLIAVDGSFTDATTGVKTNSNTGPQVVPGVFASARIGDTLAVGVGFYTPFGLAIQWPWTNAPQADVVTDEALRTYFITPSVGVNLGKWLPGLTIGGGVDIVPATVELHQNILLGTDYGTAHLAGSAVGVGGRVGAMYRPAALHALSVGVMWRSQVSESFSGNGAFTAPMPYRAELPPDGAISAKIVLPQSVTGGVAYRPIDALELEADVVWTGWSSFKQLAIALPNMTTVSQAKNYTDTTTVRVGAEYAMPEHSLALRAGFIYDPTPVPATTLAADLPDIDRYDACLGASYQVHGYDLHLGLLWVIPGTRTTASGPNAPEYKGTFDVTAFVASIGVSGKIM